MYKIKLAGRKWVLLLVVVFVLFAGTAMADGLRARYVENGGQRSVLELIVEKPAPSSVIVTQQIPARNKVKKTSPPYKKYEVKNNSVTWFFKRPSPGVFRIITVYETPLTGGRATAVIRCKNPISGQLMNFRVP